MIHERYRFLNGFTRSLAEIGGEPRSRRMLRTLFFLALLGILLGPGSAPALRNRFSQEELGEQDKKVAESIAAYPASARRAALIVAGYPEELLEIQEIQRASADDFAALVSSMPRIDQKELWNLVRYPGLAAEIARGGRKSASELERIASRYPAEDRAAIERQGRERYPTWVQIYAIELEVEQAFSELLSDQPDEVRNAFDELTKHPDLMSILLDNMRMTTVLGALYRDDRDGVEAHYDALHAQVASRQQAEERAWSDEVRNPDAAAELARAARAFAEAYDYDLDAEIEEVVHSDRAQSIQTKSYVAVLPYPYWFGHPNWYDVAYWYPLPVWSHVGFRFGHGHGFVSFGLPSPLFLNWYHSSYVSRFQLGHHDHYGHAQHHQVRYYQKHRSFRFAGRTRHQDSRSRHLADRNRRQRHSDSARFSRVFAPTFRKHDSRESETRDLSLRHRKSERYERRARSSKPRETTRKQREAKRTQRSVDRRRSTARSSARQSARADHERDRQWSATRRNEKRVHHRTARMERREARSVGRLDSHRGAYKPAASLARKNHRPHRSVSSFRSDSHGQRRARWRR